MDTTTEKLELKLTFTDATGRLHILDIVKVGNDAFDVQMLGDNIKLTSRLQGLVDDVLRREHQLI